MVRIGFGGLDGLWLGVFVGSEEAELLKLEMNFDIFGQWILQGSNPGT